MRTSRARAFGPIAARMGHGIKTPLLFAIVLVIFVASCSYLATSAFADQPVPATDNLARAGQYCVSCHSVNDPRLKTALTWDGNSSHIELSPCPTIQRIRFEFSYTADAFDAIANANTDIASHGASTVELNKRLLAVEESFPRLAETSYRSADAGVNEARLFRFQLNKVYTQAQNEKSAWLTNVMLVVGIIVSLFLLFSFAWGLWNTRHLKINLLHSFRPGLGAIFFVLLILVSFALPIFNPPVQSVAATTSDLERQAAIDAATQTAANAENISAVGWQLARLAATDKGIAGPAMTNAFSATSQLESNGSAYWGRARTLEESALGWEKAPDAAPPIVARIKTAAFRTWAYAAMADEINGTDPRRAASLLNVALARTKANPDAYTRSLDLKKIAVAWVPLDRVHALETAKQITDPFIAAWAYREIGQFDLAITAAKQVSDPSQRAFALREIAVATKNPALFDEALSVAQALPNPARAYALADLADVWPPTDPKRAQITNSITSEYHDALAYALAQMGSFADAWKESEKMGSGFEQARTQNELVAAWSRVSPNEALTAAQIIRDPFMRAQAQRDVVAALAPSDAARALAETQQISVPFARVQALTAVAQVTHNAATFQQAADLVNELHDPYPARNLAIAWATIDPNSALGLVDKLDRESDRAEVLLAVAVALAPSDHARANAVFDRAVKQAQAARLRGDPLYSSELLRELGSRCATTDPAKAAEAFSAALKIALQVSTAF
jgi:hypothetical protein